jgi:hypothetical protein
MIRSCFVGVVIVALLARHQGGETNPDAATGTHQQQTGALKEHGQDEHGGADQSNSNRPKHVTCNHGWRRKSIIGAFVIT